MKYEDTHVNEPGLSVVRGSRQRLPSGGEAELSPQVVGKVYSSDFAASPPASAAAPEAPASAP
jgi:hypothetical protein